MVKGCHSNELRLSPNARADGTPVAAIKDRRSTPLLKFRTNGSQTPSEQGGAP
jgi:hypothetical protein